MPKNKIFDSFRPYAAQIIFVDRGKGITAPNLQAAIEEIQERLDKIDDHLHRGEGDNSVQIGPDSVAFGDSSIALGHVAITSEEAERSVSLGADSQAYGVSSVAIGDGALAVGAGAVAIGPGAYADEDNIIALGNPGHTVIIPGNLDVLGKITSGVKSNVSWIGPSDDVIAEIQTPIEVTDPSGGQIEKQLTLKNPGRYRIKGLIYVVGESATLEILENGEPITNPVSTTGQNNFSVDFNRDIGLITTLTFRLVVKPLSGIGLPAFGSVSQIRICGTETDIGSAVIPW